MKILSVGDIHGKSIWNTINADLYDRIYFAGDLYDAFEYTQKQIHSNALELVQWARDAGNVFFCIGNHDAHYFKWQEGDVHRLVRGSGYASSQQYKAFHLYIENKELFKVAHQVDNYLWTHAGLSQAGYEFHYHKTERDLRNIYGLNTLADILNKMWDINYLPLFYVPLSRGGDDTFGGPLWASHIDTSGNPLEDYHQIVGHTVSADIIHKGNEDTSITYIDCLNTQIGKFYEIEISTI